MEQCFEWDHRLRPSFEDIELELMALLDETPLSPRDTRTTQVESAIAKTLVVGFATRKRPAEAEPML